LIGVEYIGIGRACQENVYVYALASSTGSLRWLYETESDIVASPALSADGSYLYVGSLSCKVCALVASNGSLLWCYETGGSVVSSPVLSSDGSSIYVSSLDGLIYCLISLTGALRWQHQTGGNVFASPVLSSDGTTWYVGNPAASGSNKRTVKILPAHNILINGVLKNTVMKAEVEEYTCSATSKNNSSTSDLPLFQATSSEHKNNLRASPWMILCVIPVLLY
jgi:outer membrane protein assembly factor BamB